MLSVAALVRELLAPKFLGTSTPCCSKPPEVAAPTPDFVPRPTETVEATSESPAARDDGSEDFTEVTLRVERSLFSHKQVATKPTCFVFDTKKHALLRGSTSAQLRCPVSSQQD
jgi:hypothetical protein